MWKNINGNSLLQPKSNQLDDADLLKSKTLCGTSIVFSIISLIIAMIIVLMIPKILKIFFVEAGIMIIFTFSLYYLCACILSVLFIIPSLAALITASSQIGISRNKMSVTALILSLLACAMAVVAIIALFKSPEWLSTQKSFCGAVMLVSRFIF